MLKNLSLLYFYYHIFYSIIYTVYKVSDERG